MSGVFKAIGKIFKKVGKIVKKILPYAAIAAAVIFAAPAVAGALGIGAAGAAGATAGAAGAVGGGVAGAAAGAGLSTGVGGFLSSALGGLLSSSTAGSLLAGGARGLMQNMQMKDEQKFLIDAENRRLDRYKGSGDAASFAFSGSGAPQGLGVTSLTDPTAVAQNVASRPPRPSVVEAAATPRKAPRYQYNPATGRIDFA